MSTSAPTVGIIGLGYGRAHIPAFQAHGCRVVAVCQRDQATVKALADRYGVPGVFARWEDMLEKARPDIAVIASFRDGVRAQAVLDAVLEATTRGDWVAVHP